MKEDGKQMFSFDVGAMSSRIFLVGCSRSGTTLLQSLLAAHPDVATFPETNFFWRILTKAPRRKYLVWAGIATGRESAYLKDMLERFGQNDIATAVPVQPWAFRQAVEMYLAVLDHLAEQQEKTKWVEKTPLHVLHINTIERYVPDPFFVHIVRDGREVVASIEDRAQNHPAFRGQGVEYGIHLWNECIEHTKVHRQKENHYVVRYESLVENTDATMKDLGQFLGINYEPEMKKNRDANPGQFILPFEDWKENVTRPIRKTPSKFQRLFRPAHRAQIKKRLALDTWASALRDL